jgi:hypothetical protein
MRRPDRLRRNPHVVEERKSSTQVGCCLIKGIYVEAFTAGHREVAKGFFSVIGLAVMISQFLGHFSEAVTAAAQQPPRPL